MLAVYAYMIKWLADHEWIPAAAVGKAGGSIVGVLSMGMYSSLSSSLGLLEKVPKAVLMIPSDGSFALVSLLISSEQVGRRQEAVGRSADEYTGWHTNGAFLCPHTIYLRMVDARRHVIRLY